MRTTKIETEEEFKAHTRIPDLYGSPKIRLHSQGCYIFYIRTTKDVIVVIGIYSNIASYSTITRATYMCDNTIVAYA